MTKNSIKYNERLVDGIMTMEKLFQSIDAQKLHDHPVPGKWSMHECLCHITDFEIVNLDRIKRIIAEENPLIMSANENSYFANLFYENRSYGNELTLFKSARTQLIEIVLNLQEEDFLRTCIHNEIGKLTATDWILRTCGHAEHHFVLMDEKRVALGLSPVGCTKQPGYPSINIA